jgi:hypothetical protein
MKLVLSHSALLFERFEHAREVEAIRRWSVRYQSVGAVALRRRNVRSHREAFDNSDHVGLEIHNYRWRLGLARGESKYDDLEKAACGGSSYHACEQSPHLSFHRPPVLICPSISASARKLLKSRDIVAAASFRSPRM